MYTYAEAGPVRRLLRQVVTTAPVAWLASRFLPGLDRWAYRWTQGRWTPSSWLTGLPIIVLITTGARTGARRTTRLLGVPEGDRIVVIAANFGRTSNPSWYHNMRAHPRVSVVVGGVESPYFAEEIRGPERDESFQRAVAMNPGWRRFRDRSGARSIPVFRLSAVPTA